MAQSGDFIVLAPTADAPEGEVVRVEVQGHALAVYNVDGVFYASDDLCNHGNASLSEGYLDGDTIECPLHGGCFKVTDGSPCAPPVIKPMVTYSVAEREGNIVLTQPEQLSLTNG
jgi:nitrite reductase/ring-hydroxylating ferredoxin subunit